MRRLVFYASRGWPAPEGRTGDSILLRTPRAVGEVHYPSLYVYYASVDEGNADGGGACAPPALDERGARQVVEDGLNPALVEGEAPVVLHIEDGTSLVVEDGSLAAVDVSGAGPDRRARVIDRVVAEVHRAARDRQRRGARDVQRATTVQRPAAPRHLAVRIERQVTAPAQRRPCKHQVERRDRVTVDGGGAQGEGASRQSRGPVSRDGRAQVRRVTGRELQHRGPRHVEVPGARAGSRDAERAGVHVHQPVILQRHVHRRRAGADGLPERPGVGEQRRRTTQVEREAPVVLDVEEGGVVEPGADACVDVPAA